VRTIAEYAELEAATAELVNFILAPGTAEVQVSVAHPALVKIIALLHPRRTAQPMPKAQIRAVDMEEDL